MDGDIYILQPEIRHGSSDTGFQFLQFLFVYLLFFPRIDIERARTVAHHNAVKPVKVILTNRVELVVVTTGTGNGNTQHGLR